MKKQGTVIIIPVNDAEAVLIAQLAKSLETDTIISRQQHGASVDKGRDFLPLIKKGNWKKVVIVEMPGIKTEKQIRKLGCDLEIIDHHNYTGLERSHHAKTGRMLPSSLEQFLKHFKVTDTKLKTLGFKPELVKGIGIMDRGFIWGLQEAGYTKQEIKEVMVYRRELLGTIRGLKNEKQREQAAQRAWKKAEKWNGYFVVKSNSEYYIRATLSFLMAEERGKPTPLILIEENGNRFYVQESKNARKLYDVFGGFTYGTHQNWGYRNDKEKQKITLEDVKEVLSGKK